MPITDAEWYKITKDCIQGLSWAGAIIAAAMAVFKGISEIKENRLQRERELRWQQANIGRELVDKMVHSQAAIALRMLEYADETTIFEGIPGSDKAVNKQDIIVALSLNSQTSSPKYTYIRECFEILLYHVERLEYYIQNNLITAEDVKFPLEYYTPIIEINKDLFVAYAEHCKYRRAVRFFERFMLQ